MFDNQRPLIWLLFSLCNGIDEKSPINHPIVLSSYFSMLMEGVSLCLDKPMQWYLEVRQLQNYCSKSVRVTQHNWQHNPSASNFSIKFNILCFHRHYHKVIHFLIVQKLINSQVKLQIKAIRLHVLKSLSTIFVYTCIDSNMTIYAWANNL